MRNRKYHFILGRRKAGVTYWFNRMKTKRLINFIEYEMWQYVEQRSNYLKLRDKLYEILEGDDNV